MLPSRPTLKYSNQYNWAGALLTFYITDFATLYYNGQLIDSGLPVYYADSAI